jgi:hypothetical protein
MTQREEFLNNLLKKYMDHVDDCEGVNFVSKLNSYMSNQEFTPAEVKWLKELDNK